MGKPAPTYWWDYIDNASAIIVQSDYPGGEELARFPVNGDEDIQLEKVEKLISDFNSGRKTPKWRKNNVNRKGC